MFFLLRPSFALLASEGKSGYNAVRYEVHPTQIGHWKNQGIELLKNGFTDKRKRENFDQQRIIDELHKTIGQKEMALAWLKKKLQPFGLSDPTPEHKKYPYLLNNLPIVRPNQVWSTDVTYIRLKYGFCYLVAMLDWFSRYVIAWTLAETLEIIFCMDNIFTERLWRTEKFDLLKSFLRGGKVLG